MTAGGQGRRAVSAATVVAVILVASVAASAVVLYPSLTATNGTPKTRTTTSNMSTFSTVYTTTTFTTSYNATSQATGHWQEWAVANATLGYSRTQSFIHNAWNYTFHIAETPDTGATLPPNGALVANVIGVINMSLAGNWTTGYTLDYTVTSLNVTVQYTPPTTYNILFFNAGSASNFSQTIQFNATQQKAISIALANGSTKSSLSYPYFVDDAFVFPSANKTYGGDYLVWFFQTNGPKILGVFVNMASGTVVASYVDTRGYRVCYPNGACWSSPWP